MGRVESDRVVEFLLLHPTFPRSTRFCLEAIVSALTAIEGPAAHEASTAGRILGRVLSDLRFTELDQILGGDLHSFLGSALERCSQVSRAVQERYSLR